LATAGVATQLAERWLVAGVLWAIATLVHPEAVCALPVVAMLAGRCRGRRAVSKVLLPSVAAILFCVGINSAASGRLAPVATSGGLNFWLGNNPHADGVNPFVSGPLQPIADRVVNRSGKDSVVADRLFRVEALRFWREMPVSALALTWKKFRWTFSDRELPNTTDIEWQKSYSWVFTLRILPLSFGVILPLALAGFALRTPRTGDLILLLAWVLPALAASVVFFTNARFRLLLAPACIVLAASAVDQLLIRARRWRTHLARFAIASALALVGVWLAWSDSYGVWQYRVPEIDVNTGILEREAGHFPAAIAYLRRGLVATPDDAIGWVHLALALEQNGEDGAALQAYLDGLTNLPHDATILPMAEKFFDRHHLDRQEFTAFEQTESPQLRDAIAKALVRSLR
ncbi:MAG TPA: hypothetical protein VMT89_16115, partial [Candidatus Acidoferrales bacterium]|nr:hypothetical protein [Candidatus Acidoferrales bacterium]